MHFVPPPITRFHLALLLLRPTHPNSPTKPKPSLLHRKASSRIWQEKSLGLHRLFISEEQGKKIQLLFLYNACMSEYSCATQFTHMLNSKNKRTATQKLIKIPLYLLFQSSHDCSVSSSTRLSALLPTSPTLINSVPIKKHLLSTTGELTAFSLS